MFDIINNDTPHQHKRCFLLNVPIYFYETCSSQIFHIPKVRTSKFGINTLIYDKNMELDFFEFIFSKLSLKKIKFKTLLERKYQE